MSVREIIGLAALAIAGVACSDASEAVRTDGGTARAATQQESDSSGSAQTAASGLTIEEFAEAVVNTPWYAGADYSITRSPEEAVAEASEVVRGTVVGLEVGPVSESPFSYVAEETGGPEQQRVTLGLRVQEPGGAEYVVAIPISDGQADRVSTVVQQYVAPLVAKGLKDAEVVVAGEVVDGFIHPAGMSAVILGSSTPDRTVVLAAPHLDAWGLTDTAEVERRMSEGLNT